MKSSRRPKRRKNSLHPPTSKKEKTPFIRENKQVEKEIQRESEKLDFSTAPGTEKADVIDFSSKEKIQDREHWERIPIEKSKSIKES
ncbi:hypothetical protein ABEV00_17185 [Paenibacillus thiaminolyticus]|uniref:hypothetical protein n=1 Tax=Paenibacillus thiaminolyticus TaxID=49283 RepID=UPI003D26EB90